MEAAAGVCADQTKASRSSYVIVQELFSIDRYHGACMKESILTIVFVLLIVGGVYVYVNRNNQNTAQSSQITSSEQASAASATTTSTVRSSGKSSYTLDQVSQHASAGDCWTAIDGVVYDVTSFIQSGSHPGGMQIVNGCGQDASSMFAQEHRGNSSAPGQAQAMLPEYRIGTLK